MEKNTSSESNTTSASLFDHREEAPLQLENSERTSENDQQTVVVDGNPIKMDKLGPIVINVDGSMSRINNWHEMTEQEQKNTLRLIGKRNQQRLAKLRAEAGDVSS
mmetsp:Transcript_106000/g.167366  ORF Transcript_106000/g.167366 Transcript_106000/m.167366 type:complete len:106 (-) Transcript_106000:12-329(-)